jgi:hypothetical protein
VSADPDDPDIQELRAQLELLGPLPSRRSLSHQQEMELWNWAEQEVAAGRVSVPHGLLLVRGTQLQGLWADTGMPVSCCQGVSPMMLLAVCK